MSIIADFVGLVQFHNLIDDNVPKNTSEISEQISFVKVLKPISEFTKSEHLI